MTAPGTDKSKIKKAFKTGVEPDLIGNFTKIPHTELTVNYTYAEDIEHNNPLCEIAPLDFRWNVLRFSPVSLGLHYRYSAKQSRINPTFGEFTTPNFSVFDFTSKYKIFQKCFKF